MRRIKLPFQQSGLVARRRLEDWLNESVANRATLSGAVFVLLLTLFLALASLPVIYSQVAKSNAVDQENRTLRFQEHIEYRLDSITQSVQSLAHNSFVVNAFIDSSGREIYVQPLLQDFQVAFGLLGQVVVLDMNLDPIASNHYGSLSAFAGDPIARAALQAGKTSVAVAADGRTIVFAAPVFFPPSSSNVGVVLLKVPVEPFFATAPKFVSQDHCYLVKSGTRVLYRSLCRFDPLNGPNKQTGARAVRFAMTGEAISVLFVDYSQVVAAPLGQIFLLYAVMAIVAGMLALMVTRRRFRRLIQPLVDLSQFAQHIAVDPTSTAFANITGKDEVGMLGQAFNTMLVELRDLQRGLESRVKDATKGLALSESRFRAIFDSSPVPSGIADSEGNILLLNPAFVASFGYSGADISTLNQWWGRACPDPENQVRVVASWNAQLKKADDKGNSFEPFEVGIRCKNGENRTVVAANAQLAGGFDGVQLVTLFDITTRKLTEEKLSLAASVFTHAREGIIITDLTGDIVDVNETFTRITGYSHEDAIGRNPRMLSSGRHAPDFYADMWRDLILKGYWSNEVWNRRKSGEFYASLMTISAVRDDTAAVRHYVALFSDITPMKEYAQRLEHIAHYDTLTLLPNRSLLADRLQQGIAQSNRSEKSLAVIYLDLDGFKAVNDKHGHAAGDQLLIAISQRLKTVLREVDTLARLGGDEFVAVLVDLEQRQDCEPILRRLLEVAADPVRLDDLELKVSASIGVALYPQDGVDADLLMRHADQAMYHAKQAGKNRYHLFDVGLETAVKTQRQSVEHICQGLYRREFVLHYQPKVNMKTGEVIGAEALIRWQHPLRGLLLPSAFLHIIEGEPISVELGEWVITTALAQMSEWNAAGLNLPVSVNVGANQLQQHGFVLRLGESLAHHPDVQPFSLELEILETSALEDVEQTSELMKSCHHLGVRFALDDFGTGYSSLTHLRRLPAELLKIDQSFVRDMLDNMDDLAIVKGIIGLAKVFGRQVIAEGVETAALGELLLSIGCDLAQGYGIARPMPANEIPCWVASWKSAPTWTA